MWTMSSLPPSPLSQGLEGLQASHGADLGWVPLPSVPIPASGPGARQGRLRPPTRQEQLSRCPGGVEMQPGRGLQGPTHLAWGGGVWSPPSQLRLPQLQPDQLQHGRRRFFPAIPWPLSQQLKLGERPWGTRCPQTSAPTSVPSDPCQ